MKDKKAQATGRVKTPAEVKARMAQVELRAQVTDYDDDRIKPDDSFVAGRFRGYIEVLAWVLGRERQVVICLDKARCSFGKECDGGWDARDPQTGRLCHDALKRNFARVEGDSPSF